MKTINIKGKEYIMVHERIKYFREHYKDWSLLTEVVELNNERIVIKAIIKDNNDIIRATGLAFEINGSTFINKTSYIENAETSAWGRALGNLGIGIDASIASAEEVFNAVNNQNKEVDNMNQLDLTGCTKKEPCEMNYISHEWITDSYGKKKLNIKTSKGEVKIPEPAGNILLIQKPDDMERSNLIGYQVTSAKGYKYNNVEVKSEQKEEFENFALKQTGLKNPFDE